MIAIDDCSDDSTIELLSELASDRFHVIKQSENMGKNYCIRELLAKEDFSLYPVLLFADGNTRLSEDAVDNLLKTFSNKDCGVAGGCLEYPESDSFESVYWKLENKMREMEARLCSSVGASGAFFGMRSSLYQPVDDGFPIDFAFSLEAALQGYKTYFVKEAQVQESFQEVREKRRKVRTIIRGMHCAIYYFFPLLKNASLPLSFCVVSHKWMRWFLPPVFLLWSVSGMFVDIWLFLLSFVFLLAYLRYYSLSYLWMVFSSCMSALFLWITGHKVNRWKS
jgi:cellulose synthase/poly-beta-1,6-N-acetylglucosamine synthase-like glycosyltransferase